MESLFALCGSYWFLQRNHHGFVPLSFDCFLRFILCFSSWVRSFCSCWFQIYQQLVFEGSASECSCRILVFLNCLFGWRFPDILLFWMVMEKSHPESCTWTSHSVKLENQFLSGWAHLCLPQVDFALTTNFSKSWNWDSTISWYSPWT